MIGFNTILRDEGVDPAEVKLARHQRTGQKGRPTPYELWIADDGRFELYQRIQRKDRFTGVKFVAAFVATPLDDTFLSACLHTAAWELLSQGSMTRWAVTR